MHSLENGKNNIKNIHKNLHVHIVDIISWSSLCSLIILWYENLDFILERMC